MGADRLLTMLTYIEENGEVTTEELAALFPQLSLMTIRRDLSALEQQGDIVRIRGGAKSVAHLSRNKEAAFSRRAEKNIAAKKKIAQQARAFLQTGHSIYLDAGSTIQAFTVEICGEEPSFVLTSSPIAALELARHSTCRVMLLGGQLNLDNLCVAGSGSLSFLEQVNIDIAFMATSGFSPETGFSTGDFNECELKRAVMRKARRKIMLMDTSKIGTCLPFTFAQLEDLDVLICDQAPPREVVALAKKHHVKLIGGNGV